MFVVTTELRALDGREVVYKLADHSLRLLRGKFRECIYLELFGVRATAYDNVRRHRMPQIAA
jgi:hypothetical protein